MADRVAMASPGSLDTAMEGHPRPDKPAPLGFGHGQDLALQHMGMNLSLPPHSYTADTYRLDDDQMALLGRRHRQGHEGPWVPPGLISPQDDIQTSSIPSHIRSSHHFFSSSPYRGGLVPSECGTVPSGALPSDSGYGGSYGAKHSVANGSVCDESLDRNTEIHSLGGQPSDLSFRSYNQDMMPRGGAGSTTSWQQSQPPPPPLPLSTTNRQSNYEGGLTCEICKTRLRTKSEFKKHKQRHDKPYKCDVEGCLRIVGFSTPNDLDRHKRSLHPDERAAGNRYRCPIGVCRTRDKIWPRADNFRAHMKRVHQKELSSDDDLDYYRHRPLSVEDSSLVRSSTAPDLDQLSSFAAGNPSHGPSSWDSHENPVIDIHTESSPPDPPRQIQVDETSVMHKPSSEDHLHVLNSTATHVLQPESNGTLFDNQTELSRAASVRTRFDPPLDNVQFARPGQLQMNNGNLAHLDAKAPSSPEPQSRGTVDEDQGLTDREKFLKLFQKLRDSGDPEDSGVLEGLGLYEKEDPPRSENTQKESVVNTDTAKKPHPCPKCQKRFSRPCELKKHEKRHDKPYSCTFPGCTGKFGSKNDWKRHENSQHFMLEHWRCDEMSTDNPSETCGKVVPRRELFKQHLDSCHQINDQKIINRKLETCRVGPNCDTRFWCGFCQKSIDIKKSVNVNPWTERFNHIDDHFHGRNDQTKRGMSDWKEENTPRPRVDSSTDDAEDISITWSTSTHSGNSSNTLGHTGLAKQRARSVSSKRKRDDMPDGHVTKHCIVYAKPLPVIHTTGILTRSQCQCHHVMPDISGQCNFPCEHKQCRDCEYSQ
ncbi:hypothetical protein GGR52DRAFT_588879 [Hypoxylon sp. FL1284]|nr:hypothetical protein GGR52DRAFT_588879 [Hypoxylon sp. FL1284]